MMCLLFSHVLESLFVSESEKMNVVKISLSEITFLTPVNQEDQMLLSAVGVDPRSSGFGD